MTNLNRIFFPPLGIYWIYPLLIMNLGFQLAYLVGLKESYSGGEFGWFLSAIYVISVVYEALAGRKEID